MDPYAAREEMRYASPIASREAIIALIQSKKQALKFAEIARLLKVKKRQFPALKRRLHAMIRDQQLEQHGEAYRLKSKLAQRIGVIQRMKDGSVEVIQADETTLKLHLAESIFWLSEDVVHYRIMRHGKQEYAAVTSLIERRQRFLFGHIEVSRTGERYFQSFQKGLPRMSIINDFTVETHCIVRVRPKEVRARQWFVEYIDVLGSLLDAYLPEPMVRSMWGLIREQKPELIQECQFLSHKTSPADHPEREDWTHLPLVTIDGPTAQDFDDAVMVEATEDGWMIVVAIADVSHYVPVNSALDHYAFAQTTSVYFPKSTLPMLPEVLSNDLCSLRADVDRLAMGVRMWIDRQGRLKKGKIAKVVIRSHARWTYQQVEDMLNQTLDCPDWFQTSLHAMHAAALALREAAKKRRALQLHGRSESPVFDEEGRWLNIESGKNLFSYELIEKFMVLTNHFVASYLREQGGDTVFRHHPPVRQEGFEALLREVKNVGMSLPSDSSDLYALNERIQNHEASPWLTPWVIKAMAQARYDTQEPEHWGLALDAYVHFTSPIRRYPDLMIHRAVDALLQGSKTSKLSPVDPVVASRRCSRLERRCDAAVYEVLDWYQCQWVACHLQEEHAACVVTCLNFGIFVRLLSSGVEVMLSSSHLESHGCYYDAIQQQWLMADHQPWRIGMEVMVRISGVSFPMRRRDAQWLAVR